MAYTLKGITLKIGADVSDFQTQLNKIKAETKGLDGTMSRLQKSMKFDSSLQNQYRNLATSQSLLSDKIKSVSKQYNAMTTAVEQAKKMEDEWADAIEKSGTCSAQDEEILKNLQQQTKRVTVEKEALKNELIKLEGQFISTETATLRQYSALSNLETVTSNLATKTKTLSLLSGGLLSASAYEAISFEDAWTGVTKTVEGTDEQLAIVNDGLKNLATTTASTYQDIAYYAELAGQMGIPTDSIVGFTETITMLGDTTNLVGEEAAQALAKFSNIMVSEEEKTNDYYQRLGSSIVDLGNKFATTESDITDMSLRIGVAGKQVGLSSDEVLALSTALSSLGIEAAAGGSSVSKMLKSIQIAVSTGSDELELYAETAGMSAEEFSKAWGEDASNAFLKFVEGIGKADDVTAKLQELDITEIRQSNAMGALAQSSEVLADALDTSKSAWADNTAMVTEAEKRYNTLKSKFSQTWEAIKQAGNEIGQNLTPAISSALDVIKDLAIGFTEMSDSGKKNVTNLLLFTTALSPMLKLTSKVSGGLKNLLSLFGTLSIKAKNYSSALLNAAEDMEIMAGGTTGLSTATVEAAGQFSKLSTGLSKFQAVAVPAIAGVTAAIGLFAAAYVYLGEKTKEAKEEALEELEANNEIVKSCSKVIEGYDDVASSINSLTSEAKSYSETISNNKEKTTVLIDTLKELNDVEDKNSIQKQTLKTIIEELNGLYPDLNYSIDEETGKIYDQDGQLVTNIDTMDDYIKKLQETAEEEAKAAAYVKFKEALVEEQTELQALQDTYDELQKEIKDLYKAGDYTGAEALVDQQKKVEESMQDLKTTIKTTKNEIENLDEEFNAATFDEEFKSKLDSMKQSAEDAGIQIPKKIATAIENGKGDFDKANEYLTAYTNYQSMIEKAGETGTAIPQTMATEILNNADSVKKQIEAMNYMIDFQNAINNAGLQGKEIPQVLAEKIQAGAQGDESGISVQDAVNALNDSVRWDTLVEKAGLSGKSTVEALDNAVYGGTTSLQEAVNSLVAQGYVEPLNDCLDSVDADTQAAIKNAIDGIDSEENLTNAKDATNKVGSSMWDGIKGWLQDIGDAISGFFGNVSDIEKKYTQGNSGTKKVKKSQSFERIAELPSNMSATFAIPETRMAVTPFITNVPEIRDTNAITNLSSRRLAMYNAANSVGTALNGYDGTITATVGGIGSSNYESDDSMNGVLNAISNRLNGLEQKISLLQQPIDATVSFVAELDGDIVTNRVTKNITKQVNSLNRSKGGR